MFVSLIDQQNTLISCAEQLERNRADETIVSEVRNAALIIKSIQDALNQIENTVTEIDDQMQIESNSSIYTIKQALRSGYMGALAIIDSHLVKK